MLNELDNSGRQAALNGLNRELNELKRDKVVSRCFKRGCGWESLAEEVFKIQEKRRYYEAVEAEMLAKLKAASEFKPSYGENYAYVTDLRAGTVDYSQIPQLKGVDLNFYRKPPVAVWKLVDLNKL